MVTKRKQSGIPVQDSPPNNGARQPPGGRNLRWLINEVPSKRLRDEWSLGRLLDS